VATDRPPCGHHLLNRPIGGSRQLKRCVFIDNIINFSPPTLRIDRISNTAQRLVKMDIKEIKALSAAKIGQG
jgi:hypothetical protein